MKASTDFIPLISFVPGRAQASIVQSTIVAGKLKLRLRNLIEGLIFSSVKNKQEGIT